MDAPYQRYSATLSHRSDQGLKIAGERFHLNCPDRRVTVRAGRQWVVATLAASLVGPSATPKGATNVMPRAIQVIAEEHQPGRVPRRPAGIAIFAP
jgi:hypothetical protein